LENVPFMLRLGGGAALRRIVRALERLEYSWAYRVVDTRAFGLPQRRKRVFLLASQSGDPRSVLLADDKGVPENGSTPRVTANGFYWTEGNRGLGWAIDAVPTLKGSSTWGIPSPPAIMFPDGRIATPDIRDAERLQGFPADWTRPALRFSKPGHRWKLIGNAVSVPVARWIAHRLTHPVQFNLTGVKLRDGDGWPEVAWNIGEGRFTDEISSWPKKFSFRPLASFLRFEPKDLSAKAAAGFLSRIVRSPLRLPEGLVENLTAHLQRAGDGQLG
jgi:DNA (cytosine-5)-methyltransferase 1